MIGFTEAEQAKTLFYLGYVGLTTNLDPNLWDSESGFVIPWGLTDGMMTLLRNMQNIANTSTYTLVIDLLNQITTNRTKFGCAVDNLFALKVDTITLNNNIIRQLWDYDFQLCQQLANCLGVNVRDHPSKHTGYGVLAMK